MQRPPPDALGQSSRPVRPKSKGFPPAPGAIVGILAAPFQAPCGGAFREDFRVTTLFKQPGDGAILCGDCLPENDRLFAVELDPALFPDTYERLYCACCGAHGKPSLPGERKRAVKIC